MGRRGRSFARVLALLIAAVAAVVCYGFWEARSMPRERQARIEFPELPVSAAPIRLALLSDIHIGNWATSPERLERIVDAVNRARPDAVVIVGDFVNGDKFGDPVAIPALVTAPLERIEAPLGVFATLGNHDHWTDPEAVREALEDADVTLLANSAARLGPFALVGIDDASSGHANPSAAIDAATQAGGIPIAVTHSPEPVKDLPGSIPLMLAGHTHCGQVVIGLGAWKIYPTEWLFTRPYPKATRCGIGRVGNTLTIVTAGVGTTSAPLRYGAPPDWWMITLAPVRGGAVRSLPRNDLAGGR